MLEPDCRLERSVGQQEETEAVREAHSESDRRKIFMTALDVDNIGSETAVKRSHWQKEWGLDAEIVCRAWQTGAPGQI